MAASPNGNAAAGMLRLSAGPLELWINPAVGGSIARFEFFDGDRSVPVLRGKDPTSPDVLDSASFPLVPFVNRIRNGRFRFRDQSVQLLPNMAGDPNSLHGQGWLNPWRAIDVSADAATLEYEHEAGEWPWSYLARQRFQLDSTGLTIELRCRNLSADPMPCGLGQHPYFHCSAATLLRTQASHVWTIDDHVLPVSRVPATGRYGLAGRAVCGIGLDHGFDGWSGLATVSDPSWPFTVTMSSTGTRFFQLYAPRSDPIFVIEPTTHANAALNEDEERWAELGLRVLAPDEEMALVTRFTIS